LREGFLKVEKVRNPRGFLFLFVQWWNLGGFLKFWGRLNRARKELSIGVIFLQLFGWLLPRLKKQICLIFAFFFCHFDFDYTNSAEVPN
jgi:hypothetical protein